MTTVTSQDETYRRLESQAARDELANFLATISPATPTLGLGLGLLDAQNQFRQTESSAAEGYRTAVAGADLQFDEAAAEARETLE